MIRKKIINSVIKPFFKNREYENYGMVFYKNLGIFQIVIEIQSQRYNKNNNSENFRINYKITCSEFEKEESDYALNHFFGYLSIQEKNSWINVNREIDIEKKKKWLINELNKAELNINEKVKTENIIKSFKQNKTDLRHLFLLKKFNPQCIEQWNKEMKQNIEHIENELSQLSTLKKVQEIRVNSLDKEMLLNGINMKMKKKNSELQKINNLLLKK